MKKVSVNGLELNLRFPGPHVVNETKIMAKCGVSPCNNNPCNNGGYCIATSARSYICRCTVGYEGTNCENKGECVCILMCHRDS